jgi:hypothetical protein
MKGLTVLLCLAVVGPSSLAFGAERARARIRPVDFDDDRIEADHDTPAQRALRLEADKPGFVGPIVLGLSGIMLSVATVLVAYRSDGGLNANLLTAMPVILGAVLMALGGGVWVERRTEERAAIDEAAARLRPSVDRLPPPVYTAIRLVTF